MNLDYLQTTHTFHVERIMDYLSHSLPMCALHQTRTIIFFCYLFAVLIEFLLYPPYSIGSTPFDTTTLLLPIIIVIVLHLLLTICYLFGALFERASCKTGFGLIFLLHAPVPLVLVIGVIIIINEDSPNYYFDISILASIGVFLDFICGIISRPSQKVILTFEIIAIFPSSLLFSLYSKNVIDKVWIPFIPPFAYIALYFISLLFLSPSCGAFGTCMRKFFSDPEISAEFQASADPQLKPFKTRPDWNDEADIIGSDRQNKRERNSRWSRAQDPEKTTRFPSRADFQLYNIDATPENPIYLASPLPMLAIAIVLAVCLVHCISPIGNFYFYLFATVVLLVLAVLLNTRATACSFLAFTNLDDKCVDILWDHPSLSIL
ncbi:hypothetical protein GPJ56_001847 [Histomonas meleagridis]|uniref:uncharacterized protein n=1 Tax=Histomonas meleagridis TaxID=135588 RepID=UPI00355985FA|nr:hypothetical protein GPJ56_001847 [Histomonas meleagridis]KAH0803215.1 hypothetical protein GO595_003951 [Histomonas meleagridis]